MQRPMEEDEDGVKRERMNGESSSSTRPYIARSPTTQTEFRPPYSPTTNGTSRTQFNNSYLPPTPAPLQKPASSHVPRPTSPNSFSAPLSGSYHSDYQSAPRDKPVSNYYDPTSDSSERRPSEVAGRVEPQIQTSQVRDLIMHLAPNKLQPHLLTIFSESRSLYLSPSIVRTPKILQRRYIYFASGNYISTALSYIPFPSTFTTYLAVARDGPSITCNPS
jgi:hypothetical protein